ncbi:MAG TPA: protein-L-isoaspartate(D-aspartate) O-methyltransferase [Bacteroidales bacterium]|nr:protein-L-isoaspartate(D-aspartate) O-methyltransferase [Bacteroidales bacterium]
MILFLSFLIALIAPSNLEQSDAHRTTRENMVRTQIINRGIRDEATLEAMRNVPRHMFVPREQVGNAYRDSPLPIGFGQTISQPFIVAFMTEIVEPKPHYRILEIGTGSGYHAAVLAEIAKEVYTIEIIPELGERAKTLLENLNYDNVHVKIGDGYHGWEEAGPFDAIVVTAAAEHIPPPLIAQLREGGKMIIPVGTPFFVQQLMLVEKVEGKTRTQNIMPVRFVPFTRAIGN